MHRLLHSDAVRSALAKKGWDQKKLAESVGVSGQAVTNWLKGVDFPRPAALLKLSRTLALPYDELVATDSDAAPVVAFRKKAGAKTTDDHVLRARVMGELLKPLVGYLPDRNALRTQIPDASLAYERLQSAAAAVRSKLGIGQAAVLLYEHLIAEFSSNDAVIVPVMWGRRGAHENALHILLPQEKVTFIYLNLDTHLEDFKFWMAHELAHVYTPHLAGTIDGEDFADAFAGALLFPTELAHHAYVEASRKHSPAATLAALHGYAERHAISLFSVYNEVAKYARANELPALKLDAKHVHAARNSDRIRGSLVSEALFQPLPPEPGVYVAAAQNVFKSAFFPALHAMIRDRGTGSGYVQQVLNIAAADAAAIRAELVG